MTLRQLVKEVFSDEVNYETLKRLAPEDCRAFALLLLSRAGYHLRMGENVDLPGIGVMMPKVGRICRRYYPRTGTIVDWKQKPRAVVRLKELKRVQGNRCRSHRVRDKNGQG